jgi:hypothetical protein
VSPLRCMLFVAALMAFAEMRASGDYVVRVLSGLAGGVAFLAVTSEHKCSKEAK